jgi:hypothetical protein
MKTHDSFREELDRLILKYTDESFTLDDAVRFEVLIKRMPHLAKEASVNRYISRKLKSLPTVGVCPGFTDRLMSRIGA